MQVLGATLTAAMRAAQHDIVVPFDEFINLLLLDREQEPSFISLNYDLLLDNALVKCVNDKVISDFSYGVPLSDIALRYRSGSRQQFCRDTGVLLLKPHGSLNLVWCPHRQAPYGFGFYYSANEPIAVSADVVRCPGCGNAPKALFIPPLYNKRDYVGETSMRPRRQWRSTPELYRTYCDRQIIAVLGGADEITMIGYSLPAYDYDFKNLLLLGLMNNRDRERVSVRLITQGNEEAVDNLQKRCVGIAGPVVVESSQGFYGYLEERLGARSVFRS